jgi:hypothetical protein
MKNLNRFTHAGIMVLVMFMIIIGCKKKSDDPVVTPTFTVSSSTVLLQSGGDGLQFYAKCTNGDVKMTNVSITDPASLVSIYDCNGASFAKNALFPLQNTNEAYSKKAGTWKFNLVGKSASDGTAFAIDATLTVSK